MSEQNIQSVFSEAPASWNTRYIDPDGFVCQLTLRGKQGKELLERAEKALARLQEAGCQPHQFNGSSYQHKGNGKPSNGQDPKVNTESPGWCPLHQCEMRRWEKDGRAWYSHKVDGKWCKGK